MLHQVYIKQKLKILETCSPLDVGKHCMAILESYIDLERADQQEFSEALYKSAELTASQKPLLFSYAKLMLAFSLFYREQYDEALPLLAETQNLFTEQQDMNGAAVCMVVQGSIYRTFGNVDLALKALWLGHEQLKNEPVFQHFFIASSITIGGIYFEMKHHDEAVPLFKSVLEKTEGSIKYYWIIYALHGLGKVYLVQKKYGEAKECLEKAMAAAEKYNHPLSVCNSLSELGNYYFSTGNYSEAEQFHRQSLTIREQNKYSGGAITSCIKLGEILILLSKPDEAVDVLNKGLKLAEQINVKPKIYQIQLLLSEIYARQNNFEKSLFHYKLFHELREQVELEDSARKMKNMQLVFESEQTKKENVIIKKQKEEIEKKNIELQVTIDQLTRARVGKKARAITLMIAIVLFILEDFLLHFVLTNLPVDNYLISLIVKMVIIFSLSPINKAVENYLLSRIIAKRKREVIV